LHTRGLRFGRRFVLWRLAHWAFHGAAWHAFVAVIVIIVVIGVVVEVVRRRR
jgi:hypothetical protein